jgi:glycosyltransferase involved in cell wall biosynthesis
MEISVIIPTYQRPVYLAQAIKSISDQDFCADNYEVLIVDNSPQSTSELMDLCSEFAKPKVRYFHVPQKGLHNARHEGARQARGDILVYIDDDVVCDKDLLTELFRLYSDPQVGCVGGRVLPRFEADPPDWLALFPKWYLSILDDADGPKEIEYIFGCNFSIRKKLLFELNGFNTDGFADKAFWWYRGDGEIGLLRKVHAAGRKVMYNPSAKVLHVIPGERLTIKYFKERAFKSGIEAGFAKYHYNDSEFNYVSLFLRSAAFAFYYCGHKLFSLLRLHTDLKHKHEVIAQIYKARCFYEFKLITDSRLRRFVKELQTGL